MIEDILMDMDVVPRLDTDDHCHSMYLRHHMKLKWHDDVITKVWRTMRQRKMLRLSSTHVVSILNGLVEGSIKLDFISRRVNR